jgi:hypothetical protein
MRADGDQMQADGDQILSYAKSDDGPGGFAADASHAWSALSASP